jgi:formate dehydrogenase major subunit
VGGTPAERGRSNSALFDFNPDLCIVCSRCVRACDEIQGTLALTIEGRGFGSRVSASQHQPFLESECVSCGACVEACPTAALTEKSRANAKAPEKAVATTCGYCGVGCSLKAEVTDSTVVRMVPNRAGRANQGHACVKGRFAYGYATHPDRVRSPMIRKRITDPWREVSWDEAIAYTASEFRRIQQAYGPDSVGGITSSRCTNEETFLVQKLVRAALHTNNVDTCARVCHSPTGYGLKHTLGESAGTQASSVKCDVIMLIGANVTEGHPVFGSQMKRRMREGAKLIVVDPRAIDVVRTPHVTASHHLQLKPGTNVAVMNAIAHVVVTEGLAKDDFALARCEPESWHRWKGLRVETGQLTGSARGGHRRAGDRVARGGTTLRPSRQCGDLLRPRRHRAQPGHFDGDGDREPRHGDRQLRTRGRRSQPAARAEQRAGFMRHGLVSA